MIELRPVCLTIAGFDPSGGAGIVADLRTFEKLGCYGEAVVTTQTVQNSQGVKATRVVDADIVRAQLFTLAEDLKLSAIKIGMVGDAEMVSVIADFLKSDACRGVPVVLDTIVVSSSGHALLDDDGQRALFTQVVPLATVVTPNIPEAEHLELNAVSCPTALLVKGGHGDMTDRLYHDGKVSEFTGTRIETKNTHGTGCVLSSAIAAVLAKGRALEDAVAEAKTFLEKELKENIIL